MNKAMIIGHLGRDPETRYTQSGAAVCNFSVATTERWTDKQSGQAQERTEWHNITAFGRQAEVCGEYLRKGSKVYVGGSLQTQSWDDKTHAGVKHYKTVLILCEMEFLTPKGSQQRGDGRLPDDENNQAREAREQRINTQGSTQESFDDIDDDIPF